MDPQYITQAIAALAATNDFTANQFSAIRDFASTLEMHAAAMERSRRRKHNANLVDCQRTSYNRLRVAKMNLEDLKEKHRVHRRGISKANRHHNADFYRHHNADFYPLVDYSDDDE